MRRFANRFTNRKALAIPALIVVAAAAAVITPGSLALIGASHPVAPSIGGKAHSPFTMQGNLSLNTSFEVPDPISTTGGTRGWTGTVYPITTMSNALVQSVPLATAPDGSRVAQVSLNVAPTGVEFGMHNSTPTVQSTRAGVGYKADVQVAAANATSLGQTAKLQLREMAPGNPLPVQTQESSVLLTTAFKSLTTSLTVQHTGDSVDTYVLQEGAALSHQPRDAFYADAISLVAAQQPTNLVNAAVDPAIPTGCSPTSPDVTVALNIWLASVPDFSTIQFPANSCYHVEGSLLFFGRHDLVVAGNGAQLQSFTIGVDAPKATGTDPDVQQLPMAWPSHRSAFVLLDSTDLTVQNLGAVGPNTACNRMYSTLPIDTNAQSGFAIARSNRVMLDRDRVQGVYGDLVAVTQGSDQITVQGGDYECSGNVGLHVAWGTNVVFQHNKVVEGGAASFSLEPMRQAWIIQHIVVDNNDVYPFSHHWSNGGAFFTNQGGGGSNVGDITVSNNRIHGKALGLTVEPTDAPTTLRTHYRILNNSSDTQGFNVFRGLMRLNGVSDVVISGNYQTFSKPLAGTHWITRAVTIMGSDNVTVQNNNFPGVMKVLETQYLNSQLNTASVAGATTISLTSAPDDNEPPLLIGTQTLWVANSGVSGVGPYRIVLHGIVVLAYPIGTPVLSSPNTNTAESHNIVTFPVG